MKLSVIKIIRNIFIILALPFAMHQGRLIEKYPEFWLPLFVIYLAILGTGGLGNAAVWYKPEE